MAQRSRRPAANVRLPDVLAILNRWANIGGPSAFEQHYEGIRNIFSFVKAGHDARELLFFKDLSVPVRTELVSLTAKAVASGLQQMNASNNYFLGGVPETRLEGCYLLCTSFGMCIGSWTALVDMDVGVGLQVARLVVQSGLLPTLAAACSGAAAEIDQLVHQQQTEQQQQQQQRALTKQFDAARYLSVSLLKLWSVLIMAWPGNRMTGKTLAVTVLPAARLAAAAMTLLAGPSSSNSSSSRSASRHSDRTPLVWADSEALEISLTTMAQHLIVCLYGERLVEKNINEVRQDSALLQLMTSADILLLSMVHLASVTQLAHRELKGKSPVKVAAASSSSSSSSSGGVQQPREGRTKIVVEPHHLELYKALGFSSQVAEPPGSTEASRLLGSLPAVFITGALVMNRYNVLGAVKGDNKDSSATITRQQQLLGFSSPVVPVALQLPLLLVMLEVPLLLPELQLTVLCCSTMANVLDAVEFDYTIQQQPPPQQQQQSAGYNQQDEQAAAAAAALVQPGFGSLVKPVLQQLGPVVLHAYKNAEAEMIGADGPGSAPRDDVLEMEAAALRIYGTLLLKLARRVAHQGSAQELEAELLLAFKQQPFIFCSAFEAGFRAEAEADVWESSEEVGGTASQVLRVLQDSEQDQQLVSATVAAAAMSDRLKCLSLLLSMLKYFANLYVDVAHPYEMLAIAIHMQVLARNIIKQLLGGTTSTSAAVAAAAPAAAGSSTGTGQKTSLSKQAAAAGSSSSSSQQDQLLPWLVLLARSLQFSGQAYLELFGSRSLKRRGSRECALQMASALATDCAESVGLIRNCLKQFGLAGEAKAAARDLAQLLQECSETRELLDDALLLHKSSSELDTVVGVDSGSMTGATAVHTEPHSVGVAATEQAFQQLQLQEQVLQQLEGHAQQQQQQQQVEGESKHQRQVDQENEQDHSEDYEDFSSSCSSNSALVEELEGLGLSLKDFGESVCGHLPMPHCCNNPACTNMAKPSEAKLAGGRNTKCTGCNRLARYCSTDCQKSHWDNHKAACRRLKNAAAG